MRGWKLVIVAEVISCVGILIRSVYRVAELSQGFRGHLATTESVFYGLDTYPLFLAIVVYVPFWPARILGDAGQTLESKEAASDGSVALEQSPMSLPTVEKAD